MNFIKTFESFNNKTLYIFDFDETLVSSKSFEELSIEFIKEGITIESLLKKSVNSINKDINDLKYENDRIYIDDPNNEIDIKGNWVRKKKRVYLITPNKFYYTDLSLPYKKLKLTELYNKVENKCIVTARPKDMEKSVIKSLNKFDLDKPKYGLFCYPNNEKDIEHISIWKGKTIIKIIKETGFTDVIFYDDNSKLVNTVDKMIKESLPDINWKSIKVK